MQADLALFMENTMQVKLISGMVAGLFIAGAGVAIAQSTAPASGANVTSAAPTAPADKMARPHHGHGHGHGHEQGQYLDQLDKDKDGSISKAEAAGHPMLSSRFATIDGNKDGKLSRDELQASHKAMQGKHRERADAHFKAADKDGDGALSQQEAEAAAREKVAHRFERLDADKDGKLTREEMRAGHGHGHGHGPQHKPVSAS